MSASDTKLFTAASFATLGDVTRDDILSNMATRSGSGSNTGVGSSRESRVADPPGRSFTLTLEAKF